MGQTYDAVVVGTGPNGLAAAITLAREGCSVLVFESAETVGGGARTRELMLPGFRHDVCSAVHPMAAASPLIRSLPLDRYGVTYLESPAALAHPMDDGSVALLERDVSASAEGLGIDQDAYSSRIGPLVAAAEELFPVLLGPLRLGKNPLKLARFGSSALRSAESLASSWFRGGAARALFAGCAAHASVKLDSPGSAAIGLVLMMAAHAVGWPLIRGGSQMLVDAMARHLEGLGGRIELGRRVASLTDLPRARAVLFDISPAALLRICGERLPSSYRDKLAAFRPGPGVFKLDWALGASIPWTNPACSRAATLHLGGTFEEIALGEAQIDGGQPARRPLVLLVQPSLFDPTRAPRDRHTAWAYCHVPRGSRDDWTDAIEGQVERFAPGFRERIIGRHSLSPAALEKYNENYVGGDITGGANHLLQLFARPVASMVPYSVQAPGMYLCSSSTPPGAGVHGMCGYHAARAALRQVFGRRIPLAPHD